MKKKVLVVILTIAMLMASSVIAFAEDHQLVYDIAYDAEKNVVTVSLAVENALGLEAADFNLAFDEAMFEYTDCIESDVENEAMIIAGKATTESGLATCSVIFMDACIASDLNDKGMLELVTFVFTPVTADYELTDFCYWASSYTANDNDIVNTVKVLGKQDLMEDRTAVVTVVVPENVVAANGSNSSNISTEVDSDWLVYLIAGVLAIGAIVGVAMFVIKKNRKEEELATVAENSEAENSDK